MSDQLGKTTSSLEYPPPKTPAPTGPELRLDGNAFARLKASGLVYVIDPGSSLTSPTGTLTDENGVAHRFRVALGANRKTRRAVKAKGKKGRRR